MLLQSAVYPTGVVCPTVRFSTYHSTSNKDKQRAFRRFQFFLSCINDILPIALAREVMQLPPYVRLSVRLFPLYLRNRLTVFYRWPRTFAWVVHDHSCRARIEGRCHRSRSSSSIRLMRSVRDLDRRQFFFYSFMSNHFFMRKNVSKIQRSSVVQILFAVTGQV